MNRHDRVRWLVQQNFDADQLEFCKDKSLDVFRESQKKLREHIDKIRRTNENVYERCYVWSGEPMSKTQKQCEQESAYKRLEAEYQSAIDAYSVIRMHAQIAKDVTGRVPDELDKILSQAEHRKEKAREALIAYTRKNVQFENWNFE